MSGLISASPFLDDKTVNEIDTVMRKEMAKTMYRVIGEKIGRNVPRELLQDLEKVFRKTMAEAVLHFHWLSPYELSLLTVFLRVPIGDFYFGHIYDTEVNELIDKILSMHTNDIEISGMIKPFDKLIVTDIEIKARDEETYIFAHDEVYPILDFYDEIYCSAERINDSCTVFRFSYSPPIDPWDF